MYIVAVLDSDFDTCVFICESVSYISDKSRDYTFLQGE